MSEIQNKIDRITDILRRDDGISGAMHYTEQISWILFLKFLNDFEINKADEAILKGKEYEYVIRKDLRWENWACPKDGNGRLDVKRALTGSDLIEFVNKTLFDYLEKFKNNTNDPKSIKYKIGAIFEFLDNRIASGHTLREVLDIIDSLDFQSSDELFELSHIYENLLKGMGSDGGNSGEFYTPRAIIKAMVETINPQVGETIYDGAVGSAGFLVEAFKFMTSKKKKEKLSASDWETIQTNTFYGQEKTSLGYVMGMMNMILHGIESPNVYKGNTLTQNIRDFQEKDRHNIILANPPFGGKEKTQIQQNFPIEINATEMLFIQHFMKMLRIEGRAAIIIPEGVLFQTTTAFIKIKQDLLKGFNVHTIVSLPSGVFLPYSGVKTNILFFDRKGSTSEIWYYEVNPPYKLTKNKPIAYQHMQEFVDLFKNPQKRNHTNSKKAEGCNDWTVSVSEIIDFNLSAKNPNNILEVKHITPIDILDTLREEASKTELIIDSARTLIKQELESLKQKYELKPLREVVTVINGRAYKQNELLNSGKYLVLRVGNFFTNKNWYYSDLELEDNKYCEKGDLLYAWSASFGPKIWDGEKAIYHYHIWKMLPKNNKITKKYLFYQLERDTEKIKEEGGRGVGMMHITKAGIEGRMLVVPPISVQNKIVAMIDEFNLLFEKLIEIQTEISKSLLGLKSSLLDQAFKGEL